MCVTVFCVACMRLNFHLEFRNLLIVIERLLTSLTLKRSHYGNRAGGVFMISLMYVSCNSMPLDTANPQVQAIVDKSVLKNKRADITGALIFVGVHFCQFLEGPDDAVISLMDTIRADTRHNDIWVVYQEAVTDRRFADWSMAYRGRSEFVSGHLLEIVSASNEAERQKAVKSVISIMEEFVR